MRGAWWYVMVHDDIMGDDGIAANERRGVLSGRCDGWQ